MATILEKITQQVQNPSKVFLFKEGIFYKAYNQGAYLMRHKNYKVHVKKIKNIENNVLTIGFPIAVFEALKKDFAIQDFEFYSCFDTPVVFNETEYQNWYTDKINTNREDMKLITQREIKTESSFITELTAQIINYPLANKTPMEVFLWVASLQCKIINLETAV
ncbi:hypothetical protein ACM55I_13855 [Flavobacterium sp. GB2R13]|uniref:hypothetical protein n=1 Tax=Flavobacterium algoris TaxID=3398733 RepID=UPI003A87EF20